MVLLNLLDGSVSAGSGTHSKNYKIVSRKVCLLQSREVRALRESNRRPNCLCHGHISRADAEEAMRAGDLKYIGMGKIYAQIVAHSKLSWRVITQKVMGEKIGYTTMQLK